MRTFRSRASTSCTCRARPSATSMCSRGSSSGIRPWASTPPWSAGSSSTSTRSSSATSSGRSNQKEGRTPMTSDLQPAPPPSVRQATVREFLAVVFRRRWVILGLFAVTTATVLGIAISTPLDYSSSGRVLLRRGEKESVFEASRQVVGGWEEELSSELEVVRSYPVLQRALEFLKAESDSSGLPLATISAKRVDAEVMGKSNVIAIGYTDGDPAVARRVCDAVIRAYIEFRSTELALAYPRQFFESELARVQAELDRKVEARREFANAAGISDIPEERRQLLARL